MAVLLMIDEATGQAWRVWPEPESVAAGTVHENGSYLFELREEANAGSADLVIDDLPLEALRAARPNSARWRWLPGFHAGIVEAELRMPGSTARRFEVVTDPDRRKLTRDEFDGMVREILDDTFALFSVGSFRRSIARGVGDRPPSIARLEFLRSRIDLLEGIVAAISRNPRRIVRVEEVVVPYYRASHATGPEVLRSFRSGRALRESGSGSRLPPSLRGYLPEHIRTRRRRGSLDVPEHRQMAACLRHWSTWLLTMAGLFDRRVSEAGKDTLARSAAGWAGRCKRLARRVARLSAAPPFADVGDASPHLALSALFRNDANYRRFYRLWQDMNLGIAGVFGDFLNLPLARTFDLYELWAFLRLVRAAAEEFGPASLDTRELFVTDAMGGVTLASRAVTVAVGSGWKLCFQREYKEFWTEPDGCGSFSRAMTPDMLISRAPPSPGEVGKLVVLDAKYRIDDALNDALSSIHTYRDALVREAATGVTEGIVEAAYLITPQAPVVGGGYRSTPMPGRLFHPEYRKGFRFGAVTLRPGMTLPEIAAALSIVLADASAA